MRHAFACRIWPIRLFLLIAILMISISPFLNDYHVDSLVLKEMYVFGEIFCIIMLCISYWPLISMLSCEMYLMMDLSFNRMYR